MNKTIRNCVFSLTLLSACSNMAFADAFTPLNFSGTTYSTTAVDPNEIPAGNNKMQNAILELDNAQIDVRNQLLNCKSKYSDVDAQYVAVKAERKSLNKQVKDVEKRIKEIDKAKAKIRKNLL